jgi:phage-related protein
MTYPTFNIAFNKAYTSKITFETQIASKELGREQRYPNKIFPVREFTLTFEKNFDGRQDLEDFFASVFGSYGLFYWTWPTDKGGNGVTYTCWFDADTLEESIKRLGFAECQLKIITIDRTSYTPPADLSSYHKSEATFQTRFYNIIDKAITAQIINNRRKLWNSPKKRWVLEFEKDEATRKQLEAFFISKRGKWKAFSWTWETDRGGDGNTYTVRFDTDELNTDISYYGFGKIQIPLQEVFATSPVPSAMEDKDEIIPRRLLEININGHPVRILDNDTMEKLTFGGVDYLGAPLEIGELKKDDNTEVAKIHAKISNTGQQISSIIGSHGDIVTGCDCTLSLVWLNTSDFTLLTTPAARTLFKGKANNLKFNIESADMDIETHLGGYEARIPFSTYGVNCQHRKFKDARCGYAGSQKTCDRTLTTCKRYGNVENFGGFPSLPDEQVIRVD